MYQTMSGRAAASREKEKSDRLAYAVILGEHVGMSMLEGGGWQGRKMLMVQKERKVND